MEDSEKKFDAGNVPVPVQSDSDVADMSASSDGLPRTVDSEALPDKDRHIEYGSYDDGRMSGGYASVNDGGISGNRYAEVPAGRSRGSANDNKLLWITVAIMSVLCVIIAVCSSLLTAHFMRSGEKPPVINATDEKQSVAAVVQARKSCVAELMCGSLRGSGIVMKRDGGNVYVLTNAHVLRSFVELGTVPSVRFYGEDEFYAASVVGYDLFYDVAVVKLDHDTLYTVYDLDGNAELFSSDIVCGDGERVVSIGNALGFGVAAYDGIVSRSSELLECDVLFSGDTKKYVPVFRTTAVINAGMSGGAVFDMKGRLVGLGTYRMSNTDGADTEGGAATDVEDTGFATPVSVLYSVYRSIMNTANGGEVPLMSVRSRKVGTSAIGYVGLPFGFNCEYRRGLLTVVSLDQGTPNGNVEVGDVITHIGGLEVTSDICAVIGELLKYNLGGGGDALKISALRGGSGGSKYEFAVNNYRYAI